MTISRELRELFEIARNNAARLFREEGEVVTMWHAVPREGPHMLIATPWSDDDEKDMALDFLRDKFAEMDVQRYAFIFEAWAVLGGDPTTLFNKRPSQHSDRREILRITAEDKAGNVISGHYYILRPEHAAPKLSPFREDPSDTIMAGRMSGMLSTATGGLH